jgi:serine/threonine protein kinase
MIILAENKNNR